MQGSDSTAQRRAQELSNKARGFDTTIPARTDGDKKRRHRAIERYYASGVAWSLAVQRVAEIDRFFCDRYGDGNPYYQLPDDDAGREDALIICGAYAACPVDFIGIRRTWLSLHCPWATDDFRTLALAREPVRWRADTLAHKLGLTYEVRQRLKIWSIGSIDVSKEMREEIRKQQHRERNRQGQEARRRATGKLTREEYRASFAEAVSKQKPWQLAGISRATYYRRMRLGALRTIESLIAQRTESHGSAGGIAVCRGIGRCAPSAQGGAPFGRAAA